MRRPYIIRLFRRLLFILCVLWVLYAVYELKKSNSYNSVFQKLPSDLGVEEDDAKDPQALLVDETQIEEQFNRKHLHLVLEENKVEDMFKEEKKVAENSQNVIDLDKGRQKHIKRNNADKFEEIGGRVVEKKPPEFYSHVVLPPFNDKKDPTGPGEFGKGFKVDIDKLSEEEKSKYNKGWSGNSFNQYASDLISIHRSLSDGRSQACKEQAKQNGQQQQQQVSVVIIFHNEAWTVLLRSVHSILSRTPEHILREIILVDDLSENDYLKDPLEKYFNDFPKVQIVRATKRQGLTRARLLGYYLSTAPIVVFLDSHIECFPGWSEPLVSRITEDFTRVVFPSIEGIDDEDLQTGCNSHVKHYGIFSFKDLTFQWMRVPQAELDRRKNDADPIRSPTMPGGLFAISREFFDRIGTYDPGLDYWGGENIELSFKAWMCGGSVELVTCSHIGHIFRHSNPIQWTHTIGSKNSIRVAEVWMDDFKNYFYERILYALGDYGNVTDRKALREQLKCKNFEWYLRNVYPSFQFPSNLKYAGEIRSVANPRCVDSMGGPQLNQHAPKMYPCHGNGHNQFWYLSEGGQIFQDEWFICISDGQLSTRQGCEPSWKYREDQTLLHVPTDKCMTASVTGDNIVLENCTSNIYQKWILQPRRNDIHFPVIH